MALYGWPRSSKLNQSFSLLVETDVDDGQVELRGDSESREHELEEFNEPTGKSHLSKLVARERIL